MVVCLYQILPDPGFLLSTSPQKGAMTLNVSLFQKVVCEFRGNGPGMNLNEFEGASNERRPFVFTFRGQRPRKGSNQ